MMKQKLILGGVAGLAVFTAPVQAATVKMTTVLGYTENDQPITGNPFASFDFGSGSSVALWDGVSSSDHEDYPKFPGGEWPHAMAPNSGNSNAELQQVAPGTGGNPFPSGNSLYFGGYSIGDIDGGTLRVHDATPIVGLETVVFQIQIGDSLVWNFHEGQMPTLSYATSSGAIEDLEADFSSEFDYISAPGYESFGNIGVRTYGFQWDLSAVAEDITEVWVTMNPVQHAQIYGMQLDQGNAAFAASILPAAIPEPSVLLLGLGGVLAMLGRRRV